MVAAWDILCFLNVFKNIDLSGVQHSHSAQGNDVNIQTGTMLRKLLNLKTTLLALEITFIFCFFIGMFWNPPVTTKLYDQNHHFYINRGYPVAWAGVSAADKTVEFPIVKASFLTMKLPDGSKWTKIIDLRIFFPLFITVFLISYILSFFFVKASKKNKNLNIILIPISLTLLLECIFFYFFSL